MLVLGRLHNSRFNMLTVRDVVMKSNENVTFWDQEN